MQFELSDEQAMLRDTAERLLEREFDWRAAIDNPLADGLWPQIAELGLAGAMLPESAGGFGGGVAAMAVMDVAGRALCGEPLIGWAVLSGSLLAAAGREDDVAALIGGTLKPALATLEAGMRSPYEHERIAMVADGDRLTGVKLFIRDGGRADAFLVAARCGGELGVWLVAADAPGVTVRRYASADKRSLGEVSLDGAQGIRLVLADAEAALDAVLDRAVAASCAEMSGLMAAALDESSAYLRQREQYGAPLAQFQSLQHRLADMFIFSELAKSMAYLAAASVDGLGPTGPGPISAAWVEVLRAARFVGENAVQLHGGMGMSEETTVAHRFMRLIAARAAWGDEEFHLRRYAANRP